MLGNDSTYKDKARLRVADAALRVSSGLKHHNKMAEVTNNTLMIITQPNYLLTRSRFFVKLR